MSDPEGQAKKPKIIYRIWSSKRRQASAKSPSIVKFSSETQIKDPSLEPLDPSNLLPNEKVVVLDTLTDGTLIFRSYPERWWLLITVILLNIANYSHWVAFPSVTKITTQFYDQDGDTMDLIPTLSYGLGVPCCILATLVVDKWGLVVGLHIGGSLTGIGGLLCFLSSLPGLADGLSSDVKFYLALIGQALTGIACPFISCVPTKISQHWFSDTQRTMATILIGMSNPMGIVLGQAITPLLVKEAKDVALMNIVWFIPAALGSILTIFKVKTNVPPTPPSPSAAYEETHPKKYMASIKKLLTNVPYIIMFLFVGGAMGYISCISTKIEQIMCARGYSDQLSGLSGSLILFVGFVASFPFGIVAYKTGKLTLITKFCGVMSIVMMCLMAYFMRIPDKSVAILMTSIFLGTFSLGCYPLALELVVECTYPVDQAIGTALIFLSSSIQGVFLMIMENVFGSPLSEEEMLIQSCVEPGQEGHQQPKDYSNFLYFITGYMSFLIIIFLIGFKTEMKRSKADEANRLRRREMAKSISKDSELPILELDDGASESSSSRSCSGVETSSFHEGLQRGP